MNAVVPGSIVVPMRAGAWSQHATGTYGAVCWFKQDRVCLVVACDRHQGSADDVVAAFIGIIDGHVRSFWAMDFEAIP